MSAQNDDSLQLNKYPSRLRNGHSQNGIGLSESVKGKNDRDLHADFYPFGGSHSDRILIGSVILWQQKRGGTEGPSLW